MTKRKNAPKRKNAGRKSVTLRNFTGVITRTITGEVFVKGKHHPKKRRAAR